MRHSLAEAAVRGTLSTPSDEALELLENGDVDGLLRFHRATFGGFKMELDDDGDDELDDDDTDGDGDDEDDDDEDDNEDKKKSKKSAAQKRIEELSAEAAANRKKASARGRRIKELEAELAKRDKEKGKQGDDGEDDSSEKVQQLESDFEKVLSDNEQLRIENAFLRNTKFQWKNPKAALKLADLTDVEINDDGEVEGLDDALAALAESDPYLLAEKGSDKDEDDEDDTPPKRKRTGQPTGKGRKGAQPDRDKLIAKYPALRR